MFTKNRALKILQDYSLRTGRKWQTISKEIGRTLDLDEGLLVRQDLEHWAGGRSVISDIKFGFVYDFLTHPETLAREDFAGARALSGIGQTERIGSAFMDFYDPPDRSLRSEGTGEWKQGKGRPPSILSTLLAGCYTGTHNALDYCLSIDRVSGHHFLICHLFHWPQNGFGTTEDWNVERASGFCTTGNIVRLHLKRVTDGNVSEHFILRKGVSGAGDPKQMKLINDSVISLSAVKPDDKDETGRDRIYLYPEHHTVDFVRAEDRELDEFIDSFRWNIVI
ncbi:hypothetical protein [Notoacmeibacter marinus]|uniref:hypothetical protein n=1 Tax=Notoacmeibacter marinus TaxID=1876515 RepID=UPI00117BB4B1|nr:hypothetical protein [Notoacmeibacter marinus]